MESPSWETGTQGQPSSTKAGAEHGTLITLHIYTSMSIRPLLILYTSISVASYAVAQQPIPDTLQVKSLPEVSWYHTDQIYYICKTLNAVLYPTFT